MKDINLSVIQLIMATEILHQSKSPHMKEIVCSMIDGWNILSRISESTQVRFLLDGFLCEFGTTFVQDLYLCTNSEGHNILHALGKKGDFDILTHFMRSVNGENDDLLKTLITAKTNDGKNILHVICENEIDDTKKFDNFLDCIRMLMDHQTLTDLMDETTKENLNVLMTCGRYQSLLRFMEIAETFLKKFNHNDCKKWLMSVDCAGNNFVLLVAQACGPVKIEPLLTLSVKMLGHILSFEEIVCPKVGGQASLFHYLATKDLPSFFDALQMKELVPPLAEKILLLRDAQQKSIFELVFLDRITFQKTVLVLMERFGNKLVTQVLTAPDLHGESAVTKILRNDFIFPMYELFEWLDMTLQRDFYDSLLKNIHAPTRNNPKKSTKIVLSWMANQIQEDNIENIGLEQKALFLRVYCPSNNSLVIVDLVSWLCAYFDRSEIKKLMFSKDHNQSFLQTIQQETVEIEFLCLLKWLLTEFDCYNAVVQVMQTEDDPPCTNDIEDSLELVKFLTNEFDEQFINEFSEFEDYRFVNILSKYNYKIEFLDLIKWLTFEFGIDELKAFLLGNQHVDAFFLSAIIKHKVKVDFAEMIKWIKDTFGPAFAMNVMLVREQGFTFLHLLARFVNGFDFLKLLKFLVLEFDKNDLQELLIAKNKSLNTFLHCMCRFHNGLDVTEILKYLIEEFEIEFIHQLLSAVNGVGNRIEYLLSHHNKGTNIIDVLKLFSSKLSPSFMENLLIFINSENLNFLQCLSTYNHQIEMIELIECLIGQHKEFLRKDYLLSKLKTQQTFIHLLCKHNIVTNILALLQYLTLQFGLRWMTDLLIVQDNDNNSFLHLLCRHNEKISILNILKWMSETFDKAFVTDLLLFRDSMNLNFVKILQQQKRKINIFEMLKWLKSELGCEFQRKMLLP